MTEHPWDSVVPTDEHIEKFIEDSDDCCFCFNLAFALSDALEDNGVSWKILHDDLQISVYGTGEAINCSCGNWFPGPPWAVKCTRRPVRKCPSGQDVLKALRDLGVPMHRVVTSSTMGERADWEAGRLAREMSEILGVKATPNAEPANRTYKGEWVEASYSSDILSICAWYQWEAPWGADYHAQLCGFLDWVTDEHPTLVAALEELRGRIREKLPDLLPAYFWKE